MANLDTNPFAVLTFIAAPAILTNASSILLQATSNRFARAIDRTRQIITQLRSGNDPVAAQMHRDQLPLYETRCRLLMRAMTLMYFAIGAFAAASITSLLGAVLAAADQTQALRPLLILSLLTGVAGLAAVTTACALAFRETRLALLVITAETAHYTAELRAAPPSPMTSSPVITAASPPAQGVQSPARSPQ